MAVKQVIVIRKDLKMRRGKEIAQSAHASIAFLTNRLVPAAKVHDHFDDDPFTFIAELSEAETEWIKGIFKKICVCVSSEEELLSIHTAATAAKLRSHLITDAGLTEFKGVPTNTCVAIGPDFEGLIDPITSHLPLY